MAELSAQADRPTLHSLSTVSIFAFGFDLRVEGRMFRLRRGEAEPLAAGEFKMTKSPCQVRTLENTDS
jgi:hypothetical protein